MLKYRYRLDISYDGTEYCGWQIQPNGKAIQELVQNALELLLKKKIVLVGSGRTDSGVHAYNQVAHFDTDQVVDIFSFQKSFNGILPSDICIKEIKQVSLDFHARFSVKGKIYYYYLCTNLFQDPFRKRYSHHLRRKIDLELLKKAAKLFVGEHDFCSFANEAGEGSASKNSVRRLLRFDVIEEANGFVRLELEAKGFLYKMVRNIVGTALEVACFKRPLEDIPKIFDAKDRKKAGRAAPALGLFMAEVHYDAIDCPKDLTASRN